MSKKSGSRDSEVEVALASGLGRGTGIATRVVVGTLSALLLVGVLGGWAATSELSGAVVGQGQVKVDKDLRSIQHLDGGIIKEIRVRKGDAVQDGQVLFLLDDTVLKSERQIVQGQLIELTAKRQRLFAERDDLKALPKIKGDDSLGVETSAEIENEARLFSGNLERRVSQVKQLKLGIVQVEQEMEGLLAQKESK